MTPLQDASALTAWRSVARGYAVRCETPTHTMDDKVRTSDEEAVGRTAMLPEQKPPAMFYDRCKPPLHPRRGIVPCNDPRALAGTPLAPERATVPPQCLAARAEDPALGGSAPRATSPFVPTLPGLLLQPPERPLDPEQEGRQKPPSGRANVDKVAGSHN